MFLYRSKENRNYSRQCHKMSHLDLDYLFYGLSFIIHLFMCCTIEFAYIFKYSVFSIVDYCITSNCYIVTFQSVVLMSAYWLSSEYIRFNNKFVNYCYLDMIHVVTFTCFIVSQMIILFSTLQSLFS